MTVNVAKKSSEESLILCMKWLATASFEQQLPKNAEVSRTFLHNSSPLLFASSVSKKKQFIDKKEITLLSTNQFFEIYRISCIAKL